MNMEKFATTSGKLYVLLISFSSNGFWLHIYVRPTSLTKYKNPAKTVSSAQGDVMKGKCATRWSRKPNQCHMYWTKNRFNLTNMFYNKIIIESK